MEQTLSQDLLHAFSLAQGLPQDGLLRFLGNQLSNISYLHYPDRPELAEGAEPEAPNAHYDTNALTVLLPDAAGGLEVLMKDDSWCEVEPIEGAFVVNIGNMMEAWSGGRFKSTMQPVNPPPGIERHSMGFFAAPDYETVIRPVKPAEAGADTTFSGPLHVGENLTQFVASCNGMLPD